MANPVSPPKGGDPTLFFSGSSNNVIYSVNISSFDMSKKPCKGCDENTALVYSEGKMLMRFIRANKKPAGAMRNYEDGKTYWMRPRYAVLPWWEPVEDIEMPLSAEATEEDSVYEVVKRGDADVPATVGPSGMTIQPSGRISGSLVEPSEVVVEADGESVEEPTLPTPEPVEPEKRAEEPVDLGFPRGESPSRRWRKAQLLAFIQHRGGFGSMKMKKDMLLGIASSIA